MKKNKRGIHLPLFYFSPINHVFWEYHMILYTMYLTDFTYAWSVVELFAFSLIPLPPKKYFLCHD